MQKDYGLLKRNILDQGYVFNFTFGFVKSQGKI